MSAKRIRLEQLYKNREDVQLFMPEVRSNTIRHMSYRQATSYMKVLRDIIVTYMLPIPFGDEIERQIRSFSQASGKGPGLQDGKQRLYSGFLEVMIGALGHYCFVIRDLYSCTKNALLPLLNLLDQCVTEYSVRTADFSSSVMLSGCFHPSDLVKPVRNQIVAEIDACFGVWATHSLAAKNPGETHNRFFQSLTGCTVKATAADEQGLRTSLAKIGKRRRREAFASLKNFQTPASLADEEEEEEEVDDADEADDEAVPAPVFGYPDVKLHPFYGGKGYMRATIPEMYGEGEKEVESDD